MKKILLSLILFIMLLPTVVFAEDTVEIKSIDFVEKSENTEVVEEASTDGEKINLNLLFYEKDDYAIYKLLVNNPTDVGLFINDAIFKSNDDHISYMFSYTDGSNFIKAGEEKEVKIKIFYSKEVAKEEYQSGGLYKISTSEPLVLSDKLIRLPNTLKNLGILGVLILGFVLICITVGIYVLFKDKKNKELYLLMLILSILFIPKITEALLRVEVPIDSKITIKKVKSNPCTFEGNLVQGTEYINGQYKYRYKQDYSNRSWSNIDNDGWGVGLVDYASTDPVTTKLCTSINGKPIVSMNSLFLSASASIYDVSSFDTSNVTDMSYMFSQAGNQKEDAKIIDAEFFDTSKVEKMEQMFSFFARNASFATYDFSRWDVSKVTNANHMFLYFGEKATSKIILNLNNWNFESLTSFSEGFVYFGYQGEGIELLMANWKFPVLTSFSNMFASMGIEGGDINLDMSNWSFPVLTGFSGGYLFQGMSDTDNVITINMSKWSLPSVSYSGTLFMECGQNAKTFSVNMSEWNLPSVVSTGLFFNQCGINTESFTVDMSKWSLPLSQSIAPIFYQSAINSGSFEVDLSEWNLPLVTSVSPLFSASGMNTNSVNVDLKKWILSSLRELNTMLSNAFNNVQELNIDMSKWKLSALTSCGGSIFLANTGKNVENSTVNMSGWELDNVTTLNSFYYSPTDTVNLKIDFSNWKFPRLTNLRYSFGYYSNVNNLTLDVTGIDVSNITDFSGTFYTVDAKNDLKIVGLETWDVGKATTFDSMFNFTFSNGTGEISLDLSSWDVSNVSSFNNMFRNGFRSGSKVDLNLKNWKLKNYATTNNMFSYSFDRVEELNVDMSGWDLSGINYLGYVFASTASNAGDCSFNLSNWKLSNHLSFDYFINVLGSSARSVKLDVSGWDTSGVTSFYYIFSHLGTYAGSLEIKGINDFDLSNATNTSGMFYCVGKIKLNNMKIYATDVVSMFSQSKVYGSITFYNNPTDYRYLFNQFANNEDNTITLNYTSRVTDIDNMIATGNPHFIIKGDLIED